MIDRQFVSTCVIKSSGYECCCERVMLKFGFAVGVSSKIEDS